MNLNRILLGILHRISPLVGDKTYLKWHYRLEMGKSLDFNNCRTMNEKIQWLKVYNRYTALTDMVDKIEAKKYVASLIGEEYVVPTLKIWKNPDELTQESIATLPEQFVIKTNHSGGNTGVVICRDRSKLNLEEVRKKMSKSLKSDIYILCREWQYKNVNKRIFAEKYLGDNLTDYKFYCFNGKVDAVLLCVDRQKDGHAKFYFFDRQWKLCRYNKAGKAAPADFTLPKPDGMDRMFEIAEILSAGHPLVRVDLYNVDGKIYFGELTFSPASGFDANRLPEADIYFGDCIDLSIARHEVD